MATILRWDFLRVGVWRLDSRFRGNDGGGSRGADRMRRGRFLVLSCGNGYHVKYGGGHWGGWIPAFAGMTVSAW